RGTPATGRPAYLWTLSPPHIWPPLRLIRLRSERESVVVVLPDWRLQQGGVEAMRTIGLDVHKRFAEAAILEPGRPLRRRRISTTPRELRAFIDELGGDDQVVLEATFNTWQL